MLFLKKKNTYKVLKTALKNFKCTVTRETVQEC